MCDVRDDIRLCFICGDRGSFFALGGMQCESVIFALVMVMAWTGGFAEKFTMFSFSRGFVASTRMEKHVFTILGIPIASMTFVLGTGWMQRFAEGFMT